MARVAFEDISRHYPGGVIALDDLNLDIADGEFMILVGPSGCGKSTALRLLAGLDTPTAGEIRLGDTIVTDHGPGERDIAMVFQNYALYPHMSVRRNLEYGLRQRHTPKQEIHRRVSDVAEMLGITELLGRRPGQLSGGQRQRVAMGRALVREPQAFLLDEPLSNLDAKLRTQVRADLKRLHARLGITTVYVTHDQVEAMTLGDRIAVMNHGRLQQLGTPEEIYNDPANTFVAGFLGSPPMNLINMRADNGLIHVGEVSLSCSHAVATVGIRPERIRVSAPGNAGVAATVDMIEPLGSHTLAYLTVNGNGVVSPTSVVAHIPATGQLDIGAAVSLTVGAADLYLFEPESGARLRS